MGHFGICVPRTWASYLKASLASTFLSLSLKSSSIDGPNEDVYSHEFIAKAIVRR